MTSEPSQARLFADGSDERPLPLWPTPDKGMADGGRVNPPGTTATGKTPDGRKVQVGLTNAVRMWPTPTLNGNHNRKGASPTSGDGLATVVKMWPTSRMEGFDAGAHRGTPDSLHSAVKQTTRDGLWTTPCADDTGHRSSRYAQGGTALSTQAGGKLHGRWTLALMSFPPDWCDDLPPDPLSSTGTLT